MDIQNLLKDKVAIVTGGTAGIGKGIVKKFLEQGAIVVMFGSSEERGVKALNEFKELNENYPIYFFQVDVSNHAKVKETIEIILDQFGKVDILVNNAGITRDKLLLKMTEQDWDIVLDVNLKSCYNLCSALARPMMKARSGVIINISSVVGIIGNAGQLNYVASKAGVIGFTKALAKEVAPRGIRVNAIAPGFILTEMTDELNEKQREQTLSQIPLERMGSVEEIANMALVLASPLSSYMTGQVISVDGGMAM